MCTEFWHSTNRVLPVRGICEFFSCACMCICIHVCMYVYMCIEFWHSTNRVLPVCGMCEFFSCACMWICIYVCMYVYMCTEFWHSTNRVLPACGMCTCLQMCLTYITGRQRCAGCLIFAGHFLQKSHVISVSSAEREVQLKAFYACANVLDVSCIYYHAASFVNSGTLPIEWYQFVGCANFLHAFWISYMRLEYHITQRHLWIRTLTDIHRIPTLYMYSRY